jgi:uncharacterized protein
MRSSYGRDVDTSSEPNSESGPGAIFIVFRRPGPAWVSGLGSRQQPGWDDHAAFMDGLYEKGRVLVSGPYSDFSRVMLVVRATDELEAQRLFDEDPWTEMQILESDGVQRWLIYLGPTEWRHST